jgi:hypothetical protein
VATRKRKKRSWFKTLLIYTSVPLVVWLIAAVLWFYWPEISASFAPASEPHRPVAKSNRSEPAGAKPAREKILDEDRKKLEDILKRRG